MLTVGSKVAVHYSSAFLTNTSAMVMAHSLSCLVQEHADIGSLFMNELNSSKLVQLVGRSNSAGMNYA